MNNDLSKCKVGDWIWTIRDGWGKVVDRKNEYDYPIIFEGHNANNNGDSYTKYGKLRYDDKYPSAFLEPPEGFDAEPKPVKMVKKWKWAILYNGEEYISNLASINEINSRAFIDEIIKLPWTEIEVEE